MNIEFSQHDTASLLTVTGPVDAVDVPQLRDRMLSAVDQDDGDVLLDMRGVTRVDELLMTALTAVRSRAKYLRRRIAVIDEADGVTLASLRRLGMQFRIPVFADPASATTGLAEDRAARERLTVRRPTGPVEPVTAGVATAAAGQPPDAEMVVEAGTAVWRMHRDAGPGR